MIFSFRHWSTTQIEVVQPYGCLRWLVVRRARVEAVPLQISAFQLLSLPLLTLPACFLLSQTGGLGYLYLIGLLGITVHLSAGLR